MAKEEKKSTALAKYSEQLKAAAEKAAKQEAKTGGGTFFSTKGGILKLGGEKIPGGRTALVILDSLIVNALYEGEFDDDNPASPVCYALGRDDAEMTPHDEAEDPHGLKTFPDESEGCDAEATCEDCPHNKFGTAKKGRGKLCKNGRRLAVIPAGSLKLNAENPGLDGFEPFKGAAPFKKSDIAFISVPPGSLVAYAKYVKKVAGALGLPPHGVFTKVSLVPDEDRQHVLTFEVLDQIEDEETLGVVIQRNLEAAKALEFGFMKRDPDEKPAKKDEKPAKKRKY